MVRDAKSIYGISLPVNSSTVKQIISISQQQYGGDIALTMRSPSVRQLLMLYAEATGQKTTLSASMPYSGSLVETGGKLYQQATYQDGQAHTYASNIPTLAGLPSSPYPTQAGPNTAGGTGTGQLNLQVLVDGQGSGSYMAGNVFTAQYVADQSMAAQNSSYQRTQQAANSQLPGLTVV